ncbi:Uncharacterised protein [Mycolicibacterium vanbaalenii]|uniref:Uncharacterized protein n=1 Tax=Mycolicibacterium vanbaalenii TaxID=110539 RepID=A0A5S9R428_MYCVN|nr:hypothetical protein [Mycolicibacterium vanbaalenii]CAA0127916.1 Uncharacterised protein [Mycolicibacterium vanbaalenii]
MADIIELIYADHDWLRREFFRLDDGRYRRGTRGDLGCPQHPFGHSRRR